MTEDDFMMYIDRGNTPIVGGMWWGIFCFSLWFLWIIGQRQGWSYPSMFLSPFVILYMMVIIGFAVIFVSSRLLLGVLTGKTKIRRGFDYYSNREAWLVSEGGD
jgi:hypothetical protein